MATGNNTKAYETPNHPYQGERIAREGDLVGRYGLKNKEELWRAESALRRYRREARRLIGEAQGDLTAAEAAGAEFLDRLRRLGILGGGRDHHRRAGRAGAAEETVASNATSPMRDELHPVRAEAQE